MRTTMILRALGGAALACLSAGAASGQTCTGDPNVCGWWSENFPLKINSQSPPNKQMQAIHTLLLPNGKILCIDGYNTDPNTGTDTHAVLIDPNLFLDPNNEPNAIKLVSASHMFTDHLPSEAWHMLFCSGHRWSKVLSTSFP